MPVEDNTQWHTFLFLVKVNYINFAKIAKLIFE